MKPRRNQSVPESAHLSEDNLVWWRSALQGQATTGHPIYGTALKAYLNGKTLVVTGTVPSEESHLAVQAELAALRERQGMAICDETAVAKPEAGEPGLLRQTLVATFANATQARLVTEQLRKNALLSSAPTQLLASDVPSDAAAWSEARRILAETEWTDLERTLKEGKAALVVTVDETEAFMMRQFLDEETRSLQTLVLPPRPAAE